MPVKGDSVTDNRKVKRRGVKRGGSPFLENPRSAEAGEKRGEKARCRGEMKTLFHFRAEPVDSSRRTASEELVGGRLALTGIVFTFTKFQR